MNFMENYEKCFCGMERTSNERLQRTLHSKVLICNAYSNIVLAYRCYNHIRQQSTWGAFCIPGKSHNSARYPKSCSLFEIRLQILHTSMVINVRITAGETLGLSFWTNAIRGKTGKLETAWVSSYAPVAALNREEIHSSLGIPGKEPTASPSGILAGIWHRRAAILL